MGHRYGRWVGLRITTKNYCMNHVCMLSCRMAKDAVGWCRTEAELCEFCNMAVLRTALVLWL
jgi:hypothetical protein